MKVSFDFDKTLSEEHIQKVAKAMIDSNIEVWIVTARVHNPNFNTNHDVFRVAEELSIPKDRIIFTNGSMKWSTLMRLGINTHFDDMPDEIDMIQMKTNVNAILVWNNGTKADILNNW